jgi:hypothetical protein
MEWHCAKLAIKENAFLIFFLQIYISLPAGVFFIISHEQQVRATVTQVLSLNTVTLANGFCGNQI